MDSLAHWIETYPTCESCYMGERTKSHFVGHTDRFGNQDIFSPIIMNVYSDKQGVESTGIQSEIVRIPD